MREIYLAIALDILDIADIIRNGLAGTMEVYLSEGAAMRRAKEDGEGLILMLNVPDEVTETGDRTKAGNWLVTIDLLKARHIYARRNGGGPWISLGTGRTLAGKEEIGNPPRRNPGELSDFLVVMVNGDTSDTYAVPATGDLAADLEAALDLALPDEGARVEYTIVPASDGGAARLLPGMRNRSALPGGRPLRWETLDLARSNPRRRARHR